MNGSGIDCKRSSMNSLSRREFLKLSGTAMAALFLPPLSTNGDSLSYRQGRVTDVNIHMHQTPSFTGKILETYWKDTVFRIGEVTIGDQEPAYNRTWYRVGESGFVHSGAVQPVRTQTNPPIADIPAGGALAEVTVPFTDAHWKLGKVFPVAYRFYYATTHWVEDLEYDPDGNPWYRLMEDKWKVTYYAPATHLRIIPIEELTPLSPEIPASAKRLEVRTPEQTVIAYEFDRPVFMTRAATGARFSNGNFATPVGRHFTKHKVPSRHMAAGNLAYNGYDLPGVPWVTYITESGISFHGTYWHNNFGRPRSHGCINLSPEAAKWIFRWSLPAVPPEEPEIFENYGTIVDVT
jgi:lipoprotein-anchoring transpeptidase ErfK/SrfK